MFCSNCGTQLPDGALFCSSCGAKMSNPAFETTHETAENNTQHSQNGEFYGAQHSSSEQNYVGSHTENENVTGGSNAGTGNGQSFVNKVRDNEFVQSVKKDIGSSQSIGMIKEKAQNFQKSEKGKKLNFKKILPIAAIALILIIVVSNIHKCDECEEVFFGKKYHVSFFGESEDVCKECYEDYYDWGW